MKQACLMGLATNEASVFLPRSYTFSHHLVQGTPMRRARLTGLPTHEASACWARY